MSEALDSGLMLASILRGLSPEVCVVCPNVPVACFLSLGRLLCPTSMEEDLRGKEEGTKYFLTQRRGGSQFSGSDGRWEPWLGRAPLGKQCWHLLPASACQSPAHGQMRPGGGGWNAAASA